MQTLGLYSMEDWIVLNSLTRKGYFCSPSWWKHGSMFFTPALKLMFNNHNRSSTQWLNYAYYKQSRGIHQASTNTDTGEGYYLRNLWVVLCHLRIYVSQLTLCCLYVIRSIVVRPYLLSSLKGQLVLDACYMQEVVPYFKY